MNDAVQKKLEAFFTGYKKEFYKKGEIVIRADDEPGGIFYLEKGEIKMYLISRNGDEMVLTIFKPISFFPMSWGINGLQNRYYFEAMSDTTVWRAPRNDVLEFLKKNPEVTFDLLARLYRGLEGVLSRMVNLMKGSAYTRLITELTITAKRFGSVEKNGVRIFITESDLSAASGMTRETVSREMKILKEKGLVSFRKNVLLIHNINVLEEEMEREF
jgi:CRP/FNR family transcriptional regulator, cyclic AMP receptor protein